MERYERAGLTLPPFDVVFHDDPSGCRGLTGFYLDGRIDLCLGVLLNLTARQTILHEMGHGWSETNLTAMARARFLSLRSLDAWNAWDEPWPRRGFEQVAEIMAWGVGDRALTPSIPDNTPEELSTAYQVLTGSPPPGP